MTTDDGVLTVKRLHELLNDLVRLGYGDLPVWVGYEGVVSKARNVTVRRRGKSDWRGVFIDEDPPQVAIDAIATKN